MNSSKAKSAIINTGKGKKRKAETMTGTTESRMEEAYQILKKVAKPSESTTPDECSLYGELLATKLRSLDATSRGLAMLEIDRLLFRLRQQQNITYQAPQSSTAYNSCFGHQYLQPMGYPSTASHYPIPEQSRSSSATSQSLSSPHYSYQPDPVTSQTSHQPSPRYSHQISTPHSESSVSTPLISPLPLSESIVPSRNEQSYTQESHEDSCDANQDQDLDLGSYILLP